MSQMKVVSLIGTLVVIPSNGILVFFWALGRQSMPAAHLFLWFGILLNGAAVLYSWFNPRLSAYWVFLNIAIGTSILVYGGWDKLVDPTVNWPNELSGILTNAALSFLIPLMFALAMLTAIASSKASKAR